MYKTRNTILLLYMILIRPHLEYRVQFWDTTLRKHAEQMERIQRRVTKLILELRNTMYEEWLRQLSLIPLEQRRLTGQLLAPHRLVHSRQDWICIRKPIHHKLLACTSPGDSNLRLEDVGHVCCLD